jgi:chemotaxis protein histidine kinase CheA
MKKPVFWGLVALALVLTAALALTGCGKKASSEDVSSRNESSFSSVDDAAPEPEEDDETSSASAASTVDWEKALDNYEKVVDELVIFMKQFKDNPTDISLVTKSVSMMEKAQKAAESMEELSNKLSDADLAKFTERYTKLAAKMTAALQ